MGVEIIPPRNAQERLQEKWPESIGIGGRDQSEWVGAINRNGWARSIGMGGRDQSEWVGAINRNGWARSIGMGGRDQSEWVGVINRNMQADRGYSTANGIAHAASKGAFITVRFNPQNVRLKGKTGKPFDLLSRLKRIKKAGKACSWPVLIPNKNGGGVPGRICVLRKSEEAIHQAKKKLRRRASKKGEKLRPQTLVYAEYIVVFTTFPEGLFLPEDVLEWYRIRWQIELVFKRFKQIAQLGDLPKHDDESAQAWLYGKLFIALVTEKLIGHAASISPWGYFMESKSATKSVA